jgi:adenosylhomocysteine nucleosidase
MFASEPGCGVKAPGVRRRTEPGLPLVVTAIPEEFEAIAKFVSEGRRVRVRLLDLGILLKGRISGAPVLLGMSGDGAVRASASVSFFLEEFPVSLLVGAGAAGALVTSLRPKEVVVAARVVDETGETPAPDTALVARAVALGATRATIVSTRRPACSWKEKKEVAARVSGPELAAAVVDMESAAWARTAASHGIPWLILRAVSDSFEEELPAFLASCLSPDGSMNRAAVARRIALPPSALPTLLGVRRRVRAGAEAIGRFLERLLPEKI